MGPEFLQFGIANCLIKFCDKYFRYGSSDNPKMRHLSIGGFDSAFDADLVACYLLDMSEDVWKETFEYFKIYRDDGLGLARNSSIEKMENWLCKFQKRIDEITNGEIQFTMDIWKPNAKTEKLRKGVNIVGGNSFPYLDLNMNFDKDDELNFSVYSKPNYKTKYCSFGVN